MVFLCFYYNIKTQISFLSSLGETIMSIIVQEDELFDLYDLQKHISSLVDEFINTTTHIKPSDVGMDRRCCSTFFIGPDFVAVHKHHDRNLQYYGGFEYIDNEDRVEMGDYVFYYANSDRVQHILDSVNEESSDE